jgi:hypothetical protein
VGLRADQVVATKFVADVSHLVKGLAQVRVAQAKVDRAKQKARAQDSQEDRLLRARYRARSQADDKALQNHLKNKDAATRQEMKQAALLEKERAVSMRRRSQAAVTAQKAAVREHQESLRRTAARNRAQLAQYVTEERQRAKMVKARQAGRYRRRQERARALAEAQNNARRRFGAYSAGITGLNRGLNGLGRLIRSTLYMAIPVAFGATGLLGYLISVNRELEDAQVSFATLLSRAEAAAGGPFAGFDKALPASAALYRKTELAAVDTPATSTEIFEGFQRIVGPGRKAGASLNEILELSVATATFEKLRGFRKGTASFDIRQVLQGTSRGGRDIQIDELRDIFPQLKELVQGGQINKAFKMTLDALKLSKSEAIAFRNTFTGMLTTAQDKVTLLARQMGKPLFGMAIGWMHKFVSSVTEADGTLKTTVVATVVEWGVRIRMAVETFINGIRRIYANWDRIATFVQWFAGFVVSVKLLTAFNLILTVVNNIGLAMAGWSAVGLVGGGAAGVAAGGAVTGAAVGGALLVGGVAAGATAALALPAAYLTDKLGQDLMAGTRAPDATQRSQGFRDLTGRGIPTLQRVEPGTLAVKAALHRFDRAMAASKAASESLEPLFDQGLNPRELGTKVDARGSTFNIDNNIETDDPGRILAESTVSAFRDLAARPLSGTFGLGTPLAVGR